jgi:hypothetical protein
MNTYKITNLTNTAGKRDFKFNSPLNIDYIDKMIKKTITIQPGASLYLTVPSLPISVHKLRAKNLISVVEVSAKELADSMGVVKSKPTPATIKAPLDKEVTVKVPSVEKLTEVPLTEEEITKRSNKKKKD